MTASLIRRRPALSVVIPTRDEQLDPVLDVVVPQVVDVGGEVIVVDASGRRKRQSSDRVRHLDVADRRMPSLRAIGVGAADGRVIAIGEDHAVPAPDWARTVLDAHECHPDADAVVGCLVNGTDTTLSGRANFLGFAAAWVPPLLGLPPKRPPPSSTLSFKRRAVTGLPGGPGDVDSILIPRLFREGRMVADGSIVVFHYQDHGLVWAVANAYASARTGHGYAVDGNSVTRRAAAASVLVGVPRQLWAEARAGCGARRLDQAAVAVIVSAAGIGAALGLARGPGRAPEWVA